MGKYVWIDEIIGKPTSVLSNWFLYSGSGKAIELLRALFSFLYHLTFNPIAILSHSLMLQINRPMYVVVLVLVDVSAYPASRVSFYLPRKIGKRKSLSLSQGSTEVIVQNDKCGAVYLSSAHRFCSEGDFQFGLFPRTWRNHEIPKMNDGNNIIYSSSTCYGLRPVISGIRPWGAERSVWLVTLATTKVNLHTAPVLNFATQTIGHVTVVLSQFSQSYGSA